MSAHTCTPPGDSADDILGVAYDLRCTGCVDTLVHLHGPMLPAAAFDARSTVERETIKRVVALINDLRASHHAIGNTAGEAALRGLGIKLLSGEWKGGE